MKISASTLTDVQNMPDFRKIALDRVGIKNIRYPIIVLDKINGIQHTVASINMYVNLPQHFKGTHMSRFVEILNKYREEVNIRTFEEILSEIKKSLDAEKAHLEVDFPYFLEKKAPVTHTPGLMEYGCGFYGTLSRNLDIVLLVKVPITTVCPCSREISSYGAHNQRGEARVWFRSDRFIWMEDIIEIVEGSASSQVYSILKRPDEKFVTEQAYDRPMFVEDVVRNICIGLQRLDGIKWFAVEVENFESIHKHSAYASTVWYKQ
jgi:GTP cyclohydrolase I